MSDVHTYRPIFGVIGAQETAQLTLTPPPPLHHVPVVIAVPANAVILLDHTAGLVTLQNTTARAAPYILITVPKHVGAIATAPWKQVLMAAKKRMQTPGGKTELCQMLYTALLEKMRS